MTDPDPKSSAAPRDRKRKRKRKRSGSEGPALDAQGRERPAFLATFPDDPELAELSRAFEVGNYAYVRQHAPRLAERTDDPAVRSAALELSERIKPDPLMKYLLLVSVLLLVYLIFNAYTSHGH
jgi:hypothetical protein